MNKPIKLAFIGGGVGSIAGKLHYSAINLDGKYDLVAGAFSSQENKNKKTAERWGIQSYYSSWKQLIREEKNNVDAVVVLTPTPDHFKMINKLIKENIPVISEKPLVSKIDDLKRIQENYKPDENFLIITYNYTGYPLIRELRELISQGELGEIINLRLEMPQESFLRPPESQKYPQDWRTQDDYIPTICLDLGVHLYHMGYYLTTMEPTSLLASMNNYSKFSVIDDAEIQLKYQNGATGNMWMSKSALGHRNGFKVEVYGKKASAEWYQLEPETLQLNYRNGDKQIIDRNSNNLLECDKKRYNRMTPGHSAGFIEAFANTYSDIGDSLLNFYQNKDTSSPHVTDLNSARKGLHFFHRARDSHEQQRWVNLQPGILT